jgi:perosamine synthetase
MQAIDRNGRRLVFVVDAARRLQGLVTDGDIRRALLRGARTEDGLESCLNRSCVTAPEGASREQVLERMNERVRCVPILDAEGRPVDFALFEQFFQVPVAEPSLGGREREYVSECIESNWISSKGKYVERFEREFASLVGVPHALTTSSGTTALHVALAALGVGPGDEVIVPDMTFVATANAVTYCGAKPVLVDVDPGTWTLDPAKTEDALTEHTRGMIPVHLYGHPADMDPLLRIAQRHGLFVLEDCAEALGARYRSAVAGSLGTAACFSFYGNKTVTTGEGGMLVTRDEALHRKARMLRDHGMSPDRRYYHPVVGFNYRLTNLQAAVGVAQLERIEQIFARKARIDALYREQLAPVRGLVMPPHASWARPVCWLFSMLVEPEAFGCERSELQAHLEQKGIGCRSLFHPLHQQPPYLDGRSFPVSESLSRRGLSLPSAVTLPDRTIEYICGLIRSYAERRRTA